jgi:hypothetical protein
VLACVGGILAAARLASANLSSGTGDVNLNAIAAAVIGGTSLFGGRGSAFSAVLGTLVIAAIASGLTLLNLDSSYRFIITGLRAGRRSRHRLGGTQVARLARPCLISHRFARPVPEQPHTHTTKGDHCVTNRAAVMTSSTHCRFKNLEPEPGPMQAVVRIQAVGVCGSDTAYFKIGRIGDYVVDGPIVLSPRYRVRSPKSAAR